jgi:hypothetical protein
MLDELGGRVSRHRSPAGPVLLLLVASFSPGQALVLLTEAIPPEAKGPNPPDSPPALKVHVHNYFQATLLSFFINNFLNPKVTFGPVFVLNKHYWQGCQLP